MKALNGPADLQSTQAKVVMSDGNDKKELLGEKRLPISTAASRVQTKSNGPQPHSTNSSSSSVVGVYSSSSDPVHVPSLHSRPAANVGAIRRDVGVVGPRRQSSENSSKPSSAQNTALPNTQSGREGHSRDSARLSTALPKSDQSSQNVAPESSMPGVPMRSFSSNQYGSRSHQLMGHQKGKIGIFPQARLCCEMLYSLLIFLFLM